MGREARCEAEWPGGAGAVRLHLDSRALELRGALKRDLPRAEIGEVAADGGRLRLVVPDGAYTFDLGVAAASWAKALAKPPPDLAANSG